MPDIPLTFLRSGNRFVISPTPPPVWDLVGPALTYTERRHTHGNERVVRIEMDLDPVELTDWQCYTRDHKGRLAAPWGFHERVADLLLANGYPTTWRWATTAEAEAARQREATAYQPDWDRLRRFEQETGFEYRPKQRELLDLMAAHEQGRISCPTGWGKSEMFGVIGLLFRQAKIDIVVKGISVLQQRVYPTLTQLLPDVGIVGGGRRTTGCRVMCYSADSLHHGREDADLVLVDEGHAACADEYAANLAKYRRARVWMFSASWDLRLDNKDMRAEAAAGPIRLVVTYREAEEQGIVAPIEVYWSDVDLPADPAAGYDDLVEWKRHSYWRNEGRNQVIAGDAAQAARNGAQVLITTETLEHAMNLKRLLPGFKVVYSHYELDPRKLERFQTEYGDLFKVMTAARKDAITRAFEEGRLRRAIVTTCWNVGVNFRHLEWLIRAEGGGSPVNDIQVPGRVTRVNAALARGGAKLAGKVRDYKDEFSNRAQGRAARRRSSYALQGWTQFNAETHKSRSRSRRAAAAEVNAQWGA